MRFNKKAGVSFDVIEFIVKIFILIIVLIFLTISTKSFFNSKVNANIPRFVVIEQEILSSPQLIHYNKGLKRFEYGVFEWSNFTSKNLNSTFGINMDNTLSMNLTLVVFDKGSSESKTAYLNEKFYNEMLAKCSQYSADADTEERIALPVLVNKDGRLHNGLLKGTIVINLGG